MRLKQSLLLVLLVAGLSGCTGQDKEVGADLRVRPRVRSGQPHRMAPAETIKPTGVVTQEQALALALEHSPELKAFSLDINAAEASRVQANLRPNPKLEIEVEEVGGSGNRSGFDSAETTVAVAQPIEMGRKRTRRAALASLEKELAEWDYRGACRVGLQS